MLDSPADSKHHEGRACICLGLIHTSCSINRCIGRKEVRRAQYLTPKQCLL